MKEKLRYSAGFGLGIAGLVLGVLSLFLGFFSDKSVMGIIFAIFGITFSSIAWAQAKQAHAKTSLILFSFILSVAAFGVIVTQFTNWEPLKVNPGQQEPGGESSGESIPDAEVNMNPDKGGNDTASWEDILEAYEKESSGE
ncbi:MAG: hypothetical protein JW801_10215 [Bacteroidales bacterium]|nr:hypothetical protein [Bacteroidales bacterium]